MSVRTIGEETPSLARRIRESAASGQLALPPMPAVATRVLKLLRDEYEGPVGPLVELVGSDPALATAVLRSANSAIFGGLQAVSDIRIALARLGARQTGVIVSLAAHKKHFLSDHPDEQKLLHALWDHAIATAQGARRLAVQSDADPNDAFVAGLLHDTGKLVLLRAFQQIESLPHAAPLSPGVRAELLRDLHAELGEAVLTQWRIPEPAGRVARHHHDEDPPSGDPVLACVQAANAIARKIGAHPEPDPEMSLLEVPAIERLNLGDLEVAALMVDLEQDLTHLRGLL